MSEQPPRRRAPAMTTADRRTAIVRATLPLLAEHGANVTTRQIAQASEVAEGTVFRAFKDKEELLRTCVAEAFRTDDLCARIRELSARHDVEVRLTEAGMLFLENLSRLGSLLEALTTSGFDLHQHKRKTQESDGPEDFVNGIAQAIATLLGSDHALYRLPPTDIARMLIGLLMSTRFEPNGQPNKREAVALRVHTLLHGALCVPENWGGSHE